MLGGKHICDCHTLGEICVQPGSTIDAMLRLLGGTGGPLADPSAQPAAPALSAAGSVPREPLRLGHF